VNSRLVYNKMAKDHDHKIVRALEHPKGYTKEVPWQFEIYYYVVMGFKV
jgi:hypothetical protein